MPRFSRSPALWWTLFAAACGGEGTSPRTVDRVEVTPDQATLGAQGATQAFTGRALDAAGVPVEGTALAWSSSRPDVATVDGGGAATALAPGATVIRAAAGGVAGEALLTVEVPDCAAPVRVGLAPGEWSSFVAEEAAECVVVLPAAPQGDAYRVALVRTASEPDPAERGVATLRLEGSGVVAAPPPRGASPAPLPFSVPLLEALAAADARARTTAAIHLALRRREGDLLATLDPAALARDLAASRAPTRAPAASPARRTFFPRGPTDGLCAARAAVPALLVDESAHVAIYQDSAMAAREPADPGHVRQMLDFYEAYGRGVVEAYFGTPPDRDGNGKVDVFLSPLVNATTAAFVWGGDFLGRDLCPSSNEMELVYFSPALVARLGTGNDYQALETLVHEVKHVVSFVQRVDPVSGAFDLSPPWMEEGAAEVAGNVASRVAWAATGGPPRDAMLTGDEFGGRVTPESYGVALRLYRTARYLSSQPNAVVTVPTGSPPDYTIYGPGWHFHRWLGDAYGDATFFRNQTRGATASGLQGLLALTGGSFPELMVAYAAAILLNGSGAPPPERAFTRYDFVRATAVFRNTPEGTYPWPVTATTPPGTTSWAGPLGNGGIRVHDLVSNGTGQETEIHVSGGGPLRVVVARIR